MLRCSQYSQKALTSTCGAPASARMRWNASYELSRTLISVPNTSNDISLGFSIRSIRRLRPIRDRPARRLPGLRELQYAMIVETAADDLHADRQAGSGE